MAIGGDVMGMLCKGVEYAIYGDDYDSINWFDKPAAITKAQFTAGFAQYDAWKAEQEAKAASDKTALLAKLGLTVDELKTLMN